MRMGQTSAKLPRPRMIWASEFCFGLLYAFADGSLIGTSERSSGLLYCAISINSAGLVTRYTPAEFLISAPHKNARYIRFFFGRWHWTLRETNDY